MIAPPDPRPVAAFDFDGTLTRGDTLVPFLTKVCGPVSTSRAILAAWARPPHRRGWERRDRIKAGMLHRLLAGRSVSAVEQAGRDYAASLDRMLRPSMLGRLRQHQQDGHEVVIVSASLATYLVPLAKRLGVDGVLAVELESADGVLTGAMQGPNCRGAEKVARLERWEAGRPAGPLWAYGDSRGDRELLARADHPVWVGRGHGT